jgi:hypothetical protein
MSAGAEVKNPTRVSERGRVQISLVGLIILCVALILATTLATGFVRFTREPAAFDDGSPDKEPASIPAWGELSLTEVTLEQPEEYVAFDAMAEPITIWTFSEPDPAKVGSLMLKCGLTPAQTTKALASSQAATDSAGLKVFPDEELLLSLSPATRAKLYAVLATNPANRLMQQPYRIMAGTFESMFKDSGVDQPTIELVQKLLYPSGANQAFSDLEYVLGRIPSEQTKLDLVKALTRQPAVIARLRIRPDTDIDKLLGYWASGSGARAKDARPLLEALKRLHGGGSIGIGFLLPPFARERLFTSPVPSKPGDVLEDCHWSALNFFNATPDDRFADKTYTGHYIDENYYQIAKPSMLGDLVFFLKKDNEVIHSAVFIADDLVFTKNGVNYAQPWILTRMKNLLATYSSAEDFKPVYYRRKNL